MKWHPGRKNFKKMNGRAIAFTPLLPQKPAVIRNGEIYAKDCHIMSGYSDQHGHLDGV